MIFILSDFRMKLKNLETGTQNASLKEKHTQGVKMAPTERRPGKKNLSS